MTINPPRSRSPAPAHEAGWIQLVRSRWWFALPLLHIPVALRTWHLAHEFIQLIVLFVCVGLFFVPSALAPATAVARTWRIIALSWAALICRQSYLLFNPVPPPLLDVLLLVIYVPAIVVVARIFYALPFQRRSRRSLILDCLAIGIAINLALKYLLGAAFTDVMWVGGDLMLLYATLIIYQQQAASWRSHFLAAACGLAVLPLCDLAWILLKAYDLPAMYYAGPLYSAGWLIFSRAALVISASDFSHDETKQVPEHPVQSLLGTGLLLVCLGILALHAAPPWLMVAVVALLGLMHWVEYGEYALLQGRLHAARAQATQARDEERRLREFIQSLGHDLKAPPNALAMCLEQLADHVPADQAAPQWYLAHMREYVDVLQRRIVMMLDIARTMDLGLELETLERATLRRTLEAAIPLIQHTYQASHLRFELDIPAGPPLRTDARALARALENLLVNALQAQHGQESGLVQLELRRAAAATQIAIRDAGPGFTLARLQGLRDAIRSSDARATGLGLLGVQAIMAALDGTLQLANHPGGGAQVTLTLPDSPGALADAAADSAAEHAA